MRRNNGFCLPDQLAVICQSAIPRFKLFNHPLTEFFKAFFIFRVIAKAVQFMRIFKKLSDISPGVEV